MVRNMVDFKIGIGYKVGMEGKGKMEMEKMVKVVEILEGMDKDVNRIFEYNFKYMKVNSDNFKSVVNEVFEKLMGNIGEDIEEEMYYVEGVGKDIGIIRFGEEYDVIVLGDSNYWFDMKCEGIEFYEYVVENSLDFVG